MDNLKQRLISSLGKESSKKIYHEGDFILVWQDNDFLYEYKGDFRNVTEENSPFEFTKEGKGKIKKIPKNQNKEMVFVYEGDFVNDQLIKGSWKLINNGITEGRYDGEFKDGVFHGKGCLTVYLQKDGTISEKGTKNNGIFTNGKLTEKY